ncbi:acyl-CoA dehydrogenase family protein [Yinghuangia seranimata]|uniref:acyl-CoA dehydrogenase family protein n=1 Tax=Yinghuangia seranimata TaxID=408067 RepID=UPI00248C360E|nr:acyl-CoA dehydrogenase family protein [Yinghuangia seranimata]MDI2125921.1 acyl-CoA dehydrogenase family protein [Yinghuangia seranimata]
MDLELTTDEKTVRDAFARFFADRCPVSVVRDAEPLGHAPALWARLRETGAPGMAVPDKHGGGGATALDLVLLMQEAGRVLAPLPLAEHLAATRTLARTPSGLAAPWFASLVDGDTVAAAAPRPARDGVARLVPGGAVADVVVALDDDQLVAVRSDAPMEAPPNHASAPLADRDLRTGERVVLADGAEAAALFARMVADWQLLTAAALGGLAARALEIGVEYTLERRQFDRPIAAFQAVQQGLADLVGPIDGVTFLTARAAWTQDEGDQAESERLASMAFLASAEVARDATYAALHYHGGYGVTLEYDIQLFFRRARGWPLVLGDPEDEYLRLADRLFGPVGAAGTEVAG